MIFFHLFYATFDNQDHYRPKEKWYFSGWPADPRAIPFGVQKRGPMKHNVIIALAVFCATLPAHAQNPRLTGAQWKAVEGVYQSSTHDNWYVRFRQVEGDKLELYMLGSGKHLLLVPQGELVFGRAPSEGDGPQQIVFHRDPATGEVSSVEMGVAWNRVHNYHPIERKEIAHTPADLQPFAGVYRIERAPNLYQYILLSVKENQLVLKQNWDNREFVFLPDSTLHFFTREATDFLLEFIEGPDGRISGALVSGREHWTKQELRLTAEGLRAYEGTYRSKNDPDNRLRLIVRAGSLVVKQVWDGKEIVLTAISDTYFYNEAQSYPLQILSGTDGKVKSIRVLSSQEFDKVPE
jgi:hypothetical protein